MNKAIITGATGLVGAAVAKYLLLKGVDILCLGRKKLTDNDIGNMFGYERVSYLNIEMEDILYLPEELDKIGWKSDPSCIFYNFAWGGGNNLTDGKFEEQFMNAIFSSNAVVVAKKIGCKKFINAGTLEETFSEDFINNTKRNKQLYLPQSNYAVSKLASRDMCKMVSYIEKIDYIHTRLSVPLDSSLKKGGYIMSVLNKIFHGQEYDKPKNLQLYDIILMEDVAKAYYLIGLHGKNKSDYFIGTSKPMTLSQYFEYFEQLKKGYQKKKLIINSNVPEHGVFSIDDLVNDTGFELTFPLSGLYSNIGKLCIKQ